MANADLPDEELELPEKEDVELDANEIRILDDAIEQAFDSWLFRGILGTVVNVPSERIPSANDLNPKVVRNLKASLAEDPDEERGLLRRLLRDLEAKIATRFVGQEELIRMALVALVLNEHVLLEGLPGVGKTVFIKWIAEVSGLPFSRVQFIPDMLPSDLIGKDQIDLVGLQAGQPESVRWVNGPVFGSIVLADEINRAPSKVQAALLEAMGERQATPFGKTSRPVLSPLHEAALQVWQETPELCESGLLGVPKPLPTSHRALKEYAPFTVFATMNPIEQEGTYPLSEAQMDRFCFKVVVPYPCRRHYDELARAVYYPKPFDPMEVNLSVEACRTYLRRNPRNVVPLLLPVYFFLRCRGHVIPVDICGRRSMYQQLDAKLQAGTGDSILETIYDLTYMTNARGSGLGAGDGRGGWYDREQTDMLTYLDEIGSNGDTGRADRLRCVREQEHCQYVQSGASPRGFLKLVPAVLCHAMFDEHGRVREEDVRAVVNNVLRHRVHMGVHARLAGVSAEHVVQNVCRAILGG